MLSPRSSGCRRRRGRWGRWVVGRAVEDAVAGAVGLSAGLLMEPRSSACTRILWTRGAGVGRPAVMLDPTDPTDPRRPGCLTPRQPSARISRWPAPRDGVAVPSVGRRVELLARDAGPLVRVVRGRRRLDAGPTQGARPHFSDRGCARGVGRRADRATGAVSRASTLGQVPSRTTACTSASTSWRTRSSPGCPTSAPACAAPTGCRPPPAADPRACRRAVGAVGLSARLLSARSSGPSVCRRGCRAGCRRGQRGCRAGCRRRRRGC